MSSRPDKEKYATLHGHMRYHHIKDWLLRGARKESAQTIGAAVKAIPERRLIRRLARALVRA
jgi:hypothetical protein